MQFPAERSGSKLTIKLPSTDIHGACHRAQISCVGPLLSSLRTRREIGRSLSLVPLCLDDHLFLDENTLKSLSICSSDVHGFVHAKQGREGFSILGAYMLLHSRNAWTLIRTSVLTVTFLSRFDAIDLDRAPPAMMSLTCSKCELSRVASN